MWYLLFAKYKDKIKRTAPSNRFFLRGIFYFYVYILSPTCILDEIGDVEEILHILRREIDCC